MGRLLTEFERAYALRVYEAMTGFLEEGEVPGVVDESESGFAGKYYDEYYTALTDLGSKFNFSIEEHNVTLMMSAMERILRETAVKMFEYGVRWEERRAAGK